MGPRVCKRVLITGSTGQVGYALAPMVATGAVFGPEQPLIIHLLGHEGGNHDKLHGLAMELTDGAFPLVLDVVATCDVKEACQGVDMAFLAGSAPHRPGMDRFDLLAANVPIFQRQARALAQFASPDIRVVVIANPANTLAWLLSACAPEIPKERISALTRLDHNRAVMHLARRFHCAPQDVVGVAVWGNHSSTMVPDVSRAFAAGVDVWEAGGEELADEVVETVRRRGFEVLRLRGAPAGMSTARAACDQMRDWVMGTDPGRHVSMAVCSDGSYGMPPGLWYGFPVECQGGRWKVVRGLGIDPRTYKMLIESAAELEREREAAKCLLQCSG